MIHSEKYEALSSKEKIEIEVSVLKSAREEIEPYIRNGSLVVNPILKMYLENVSSVEDNLTEILKSL